MSEKYVVRLKNAAIYHADNPFGSTSAEPDAPVTET